MCKPTQVTAEEIFDIMNKIRVLELTSLPLPLPLYDLEQVRKNKE